MIISSAHWHPATFLEAYCNQALETLAAESHLYRLLPLSCISCSHKQDHAHRTSSHFPSIKANYYHHLKGMDLHTAARQGNTVELRKIIATGVKLDDRDMHSRTALHMACWAGHVRGSTDHHPAPEWPGNQNLLKDQGHETNSG